MLKKYIKQIFLVSMLILGVISCGNEGINQKIPIPTSFIQNEVEKMFPISANVLVGSGSVTNPRVSLKDDKLIVGMGYRVTFLGGVQEGSFTLSSGIRYDATTQSVYLVNFYIDDIKNSNGVRIDDTRIAGVIKELVSNYIASKPVYNFSENDNKFVKSMVKNVVIENGKLYVRT